MDFWDKIINEYEEETDPQPVIGGSIGALPNFEKLPDLQNSDSVIAFLDGGNCTLFSAPNFIIAKIRVGIAKFEGRNKVSEERKDFEVNCYYNNGWVANIDSQSIIIKNSDILDGGRENIDKIPQLLRRKIELQIAKSVDADYVIIDGNLEGTFELEEIKNLPSNVLGLSKTNTIRTKKGNSYTSILSKVGPETFVCKDVLPKISFIKLSKSPYVFRLDGMINDELLSILKEHARDPAILGYPYGLVVADRIARIPDYETKALRVKLFSELGNKSKVVRELLSGRDIHEFLDGQNIY